MTVLRFTATSVSTIGTPIKKIILRINPEYVETIEKLLDITIQQKIKEKQSYPYWINMPEFDNQNGEQFPIVTVMFFSEEDINHFNIIIATYGIKVKTSSKTTESFYIPCKWETFEKDEWTTAEQIIPTYSINILSYNRYQPTRHKTIDALNAMNVFFRVFVEPAEYDEYLKIVPKCQLVKLPDDFHSYEQGGIPARNFIKWYSTNMLEEEKHWILDDNIQGFYRYHFNKRIPIKSGAIFKSVEQFCARYSNVGLAGFNYYSMIPEISNNRPPIRFNGKVYSCILITNKLYNWRGKYNEDIDLSLRLLKAGYVNLEFQHILIDKTTSGTIRGGNTDTIYKSKEVEDVKLQKQLGYKAKVDALIAQHPDVKIVYKTLKSKEYHHNVDYSPWENNELIPIAKPQDEITFTFV
jgi:hypothetical protein